MFFFKMIMFVNSELVMKKDFLMKFVFQFWGKMTSFSILKHKLFKFMKHVEIACVQVLGFVKDE
jgi:hypothetical protein